MNDGRPSGEELRARGQRCIQYAPEEIETGGAARLVLERLDESSTLAFFGHFHGRLTFAADDGQGRYSYHGAAGTAHGLSIEQAKSILVDHRGAVRLWLY